MIGSVTQRIFRHGAWALSLAALGSSCDQSSVVGYDDATDALGELRCARDAPLPQCDESSCVVRDLEPAQVGSTAIAVDDDSVYYLREADAIVKAPLAGGPAVDLASTAQGAFHMLADAEHLYWSEVGRRIWRVAKAGGAPEVVADIQGHPRVLALDATYVYAALTDTNQLAMTPKEPGAATFLSGQDAPFWIVTDATHVYWINQGSAANSGELVRAPLGDLAHAEVLLQGLDAPVTLALSASDVYFVAGAKLLRFGKNGGATETVLEDLAETKSTATYSDSVYLTGLTGLTRVRAGAATILDTRTMLGLAISCSGVVATGWLVPALIRYSP